MPASYAIRIVCNTSESSATFPANAASVGSTDLLVTWLFKISTTSGSKYYLASVMGILIFIITAIISVIVYNVIPSNKNEEDFQ